VFRPQHGGASVTAKQRERKLAPQLRPQLLEIDRAQHISGIPQERHHLAVGADRPSGLGCALDYRDDNAAESVRVDAFARHEAGQCVRGIEREERVLGGGLREVDPGKFKFCLESPPMRLGRNHDRRAPGIDRACHVSTDRFGDKEWAVPGKRVI
jgi:hypothetical protein